METLMLFKHLLAAHTYLDTYSMSVPNYGYIE